MAKVFISYARKDGSEIAQEFKRRLQDLRHEVFLDVVNIPGGDDWQKVIEVHSSHCDLLLLLVTPLASKSEYVYKEFDTARKNRKRVVPVLIDNAKILPYLQTYNALSLENRDYSGLLLKLQSMLLASCKRLKIGLAILSLISLLSVATAIFLFFNQQAVPQNPKIYFPLPNADLGWQITASGSYEPEQLNGKSLWLFVVAPNGLWYPQIDFICQPTRQSVFTVPERESWYNTVYIGSSDDSSIGTSYQIVLAYLNHASEPALYTMIDGWCSSDSFPGLSADEIASLKVETIDSVLVHRSR